MSIENYIDPNAPGGPKIIFDGFPGGYGNPNVQKILDALRAIYGIPGSETGSAIARTMIDDWIVTKGREIIIRPGSPAGRLGTGEVWTDPAIVNRTLYIDNNGTVQNSTLKKSLVHELVHALKALNDNGRGAEGYDGTNPEDYRGETVIESNKIYRELGILEQNSYIAQDVLGVDGVGVLSLGFQYTNGVVIDRSVSVSRARDPENPTKGTHDWDSSHAGDSRDLLIGDGNPNKLAAGDGDDFLYGMGGNDTLDGGEGNDHLYGGDDNDKLYGLGGANYLEGGAGADEYHIVSDGKADTILDIDGWGIIELDGEILQGGTGTAPDLWKSADGAITYHLLDGTLEVIKNNEVQIRILNFVSGHLNINLETTGLNYAEPQTLSPSGYDYVLLANEARSVDTGSLPDSVTGTGYDDLVKLGDGNDNAQTSYGRDIVYGQEGNDYILAGPHTGDASIEDQDILIGGEGRDILLGGLDDDILHAGNVNDHLLPTTTESADFGDWADGGDGVDRIYGSQSSDFLQGGAGVDTIYGGAGNDVILGDGEIRQATRMSQLPASNSTYFWQAGDGVFHSTNNVSVPYILPANFAWTIKYTNAARGDFILELGAGQSFSNETCVSANGGSDTIYGGEGNDWIAGQRGSDIMDGGDGDDVIYGDDVTPLPVGWGGDDYFYGSHGADTYYGGEGADKFFFTSELLSETGDVSALKDASVEDRLFLNGAALEGVTFIAESGNRWYSANQSIILTKEGETLTIQPAGASGKIVIEHFTDGVLGLHLSQWNGNENHAPEVAGVLPAQAGTEGTAFTLVLPTSLFSDPDGDALAYSVTLAGSLPLPNWLTFNPATRTLSGTPSNGDAGSLNLQVTATDPEGLSASQTFTLTVENANDAPEVGDIQPNLAATEDEALAFTRQGSLVRVQYHPPNAAAAGSERR